MKIINRILVLSIIPWFGLGLAQAQTTDAPFAGIVPEVKTLDVNDVDILSAKANIKIPLSSFGKYGTKMALYFSTSMPYRDDWDWSTVQSYSLVSDVFGYFFTNNLNLNPMLAGSFDGGVPIRTTSLPFGGGFYDGHTNPQINSDGSTIRQSFGDTYLTEMTFPDSSKNGVYDRQGGKGEFSVYGVVSAFKLPDGERWTLYRASGSTKILFITSSKGYGIQISYNGSDVSGLKSYNKSKYYCNEAALVPCSEISGLQNDVEITYDNAEGSVTFTYPKTGDIKKIIFYKNNSNKFIIRIKSIEVVGVPSSKKTYNYSPIAFTNDSGTWQEAYLGSIVTADGTWNYTYNRNNVGFLTDDSWVTRTAPDNSQISADGAFMLGQGVFTDEIGRITNVCIEYGDSRASGCTILPNGVAYYYGRDYRNNILSITINPATGSTEPALHYYATYPTECLNPLTCNRPLTTTDANGGVTAYTYDSAHGGVLTEVGPADANGIHPSKKYYYGQRYALVKNSSGTYSQSATPIWLLTEERTCNTGALDTSAGTCSAGASDLVRTMYDYGPTSGAANNLLLRGVLVDAGGITLRTCYGYDESGQRISETKPNANLTSCP